MTDRIIIEGQLIRHVRETLISEAPFASLADHLTRYLPTEFPILPSVGTTRALQYDPNTKQGTLLIELQPGHRNLQVWHGSSESYPEDAMRGDDEGVSRFRVLMPYTYFLFTFATDPTSPNEMASFTIHSSSVFWRREPFRGPDDQLTYAAIPNVDRSGVICWGGTVSPRASFNEHIDALVNEFFNTRFNEDLGHRTPFGHSMTDWERASEDALSYLNWGFWANAPTSTYREIARQYSADPPTYSVADLGDSFLELPEMPENFSIARATRYLESLTPSARTRLQVAMDRLREPEQVEEVEQEEEVTA